MRLWFASSMNAFFTFPAEQIIVAELKVDRKLGNDCLGNIWIQYTFLLAKTLRPTFRNSCCAKLKWPNNFFPKVSLIYAILNLTFQMLINCCLQVLRIRLGTKIWRMAHREMICLLILQKLILVCTFLFKSEHIWLSLCKKKKREKGKKRHSLLPFKTEIWAGCCYLTLHVI